MSNPCRNPEGRTLHTSHRFEWSFIDFVGLIQLNKRRIPVWACVRAADVPDQNLSPCVCTTLQRRLSPRMWTYWLRLGQRAMRRGWSQLRWRTGSEPSSIGISQCSVLCGVVADWVDSTSRSRRSFRAERLRPFSPPPKSFSGKPLQLSGFL